MMEDTKDSGATTGESTALVPAGETKPEKASKKNKKGDGKPGEYAVEERKLHHGNDTELLIPSSKNGAPQWLIDAHGDRITSPLVDGLIESVDEDGIKKPLEVWKDGDKLWILDGVQRFRGLVDANKMRKSRGAPLRQAPYFIVDKTLSASELFALTMKLNGFVKVDSELQKASKAAALYRLARTEGKNDTQSQKLVAESLGGISPAMVHNYLVMHTASPKLKKMVADNVVAASVVMELAHLPQEEQEKALEEAAKASGVVGKDGKPKATVSAAKSIVKSRQGKYSEDEPVDKAGVARIVKAHIEDGLNEMDERDIKLLRFGLGQISAKDAHVKGLTTMVRYISGK